ncbi:TPA: META domain-containing protein, partial [Pseudomonas aeruginosa]
MKPSLALFASAALILGGCASQETTLETEQAYQVDWVGAQPTMDYSHISLTFDGQGRAFGNGGCNHWFASYTLQDDLLQFGAIGSTRRLCAAEIMEQERRFLALLQSVQH